MPDTVPLPGEEQAPAGWQRVKLLFILFLIFIAVVSDEFVDSVLPNFGKNMAVGRAPRPCGVAVQGIFVVLLYAVASSLTERGIL